MSRIRTAAVLGAAALATAATDASAQGGDAAGDYPNKPIRLIVPYPPGGSVDFTGREVAAKLTEAFGQQVVIDNRPGAGATIGHALAARAVPDGYTLLIGTSAGLVVGPALGVKIAYDPLKDFQPVALVVYAPFAMALTASVPANSVKEFVDLARAQPKRFNFASPGTGSPNHLGGELLKALAKIDIVHVPYKGGGPALTDLIAGQVHMMFSGIPQSLPHFRTGRLKAIAVGHPTRTRTLPDVPPVAETLPGFNNTTWYGVMAPAGTPRPIVAKLNTALNKAFGSPEFAQKLITQGVEAATDTPQALGEKIRTEGERWRKVIRDAGIRADTAGG